MYLRFFVVAVNTLLRLPSPIGQNESDNEADDQSPAHYATHDDNIVLTDTRPGNEQIVLGTATTTTTTRHQRLTDVHVYAMRIEYWQSEKSI